MYVSTNRSWLRISVSMRSLLWLSLGMALVLSSRMAVGQEPEAPAQTQFSDPVEDGWLFSDQLTGQSGEAFGIKFRAGVLTGPAVGRDLSIVPFEMMPYAFAGKGLIFGDVRGFRATSDLWGGNFGGGFRYHSERLDRIFGVNAYYDSDKTSGELFRQVGFGVETLGALWDLRANAYLPFGATEQLIAVNFVPGSERFVDHRILFDQIRTIGNGLTGVDMELATPLPGRIAQRHDVRVAGGWYHFQSSEVDGFTGWKTRIQGNVLPSIQMQVEVTHDSVFNTNVVFGAAWTYGGYRQPETERRSQFSRMTEPVRRNYNIVVAKSGVLDADKVAINPNTGDPYFVEHVASFAPLGGDGTVENPWRTVNEAQTDPAFAPAITAAGGDIIFVHADSVYDSVNFPVDNAITLTPSIRILGEGNGVEHRINVANLGQIPLPRATTGVRRPMFLNSATNGVTLLSGSTTSPSEFSGFEIGDSTDLLGTSGPAGNGIFGNGVTNVLITQTDVSWALGDGVLLTDTVGPVTFRGTLINDPTGSALHVSGGIGGVTFTDDPVSGAQGRIVNSGGRALLVENTLAGSFVNLTGSTITDTAGLGILIDNADGTVTVDDSTINDALLTGIEVRDSRGNINFRGAIAIDNPTDDAISIHDMLAASSVRFSQAAAGVTITDRNARGINLLANAGDVIFTVPVSITDTVGSTAAAVEYQDSSGDAQFLTLDIDGGGGEGILIGGIAPLSDNFGQFRVTSTTTISNVANNGILITEDDAQVQFNGVNIVSRGLSGININNSRGNVVFNGLTSIDNAGFSTSPAVDIQDNTTANVSFRTLTITGATRPLPLAGGAGLNVINNAPSVTVNELNVTTLNGIALFANNAGVITTTTVNGVTTTTTTGGVFTTTGILDSVGSVVGLVNQGRPAVDARNSVIQLGFESVSSSNSSSEGIVLVDNAGPDGAILFSVAGQNGVPFVSGGTIINAAADGVFAQNTGGVSLANMSIVGSNGSGIFANTSSLAVVSSLIQQNGLWGIDTFDTADVTLLGNTINGNGANEVRFTAATTGAYTFTMGGGFLVDGNLITDTSDDAVLVQTVGAGAGSTLTLLVVNNTITTAAPATGTDPFHMVWNGGVTGAINVNTLNFGNTGSTGLFVNLGSASAPSNLEIMSNTFNAAGGFAKRGIDLTTNGGPANIRIGQLTGQLTGNVMNFTSPGAFTDDIGMRFSLGANTDINIFSNDITMLSDGGTGMQFTLVQGPSNLTIDDNFISINSNIPVLVESGIEILAVSGTVNLFGTLNNDVVLRGLRDSVPPWFSAPPAINGTIIVNGVAVP